MAGLVTELSDAVFEQDVVASGKAYLVDFWAPWCGPCRAIAPIVDELAKDYEGTLSVGKVNVDDNQAVAAKFGISSIPTILIFNKGELKQRIMGAYPKSEIKKAIDAALA